MSPAGLKGVAEEAGLELVIVCGHNMGDIFRRNSFNLGLHVVQSPEAVADARDGDDVQLRSRRRASSGTRRRSKTYTPVPLSPKEEEIRRSGGIFAVGRREFPAAVRTRPAIDWADERAARRMTTTEQIVWAHRVDKDLAPEQLVPGDDAAGLRRPAARVRRHRAVRDPHLQPDHRRRHDLSAAGGHRQRSFRLHRRGGRREADRHRPRVRARPRPRAAVLRDAGRRHLSFLLSRAGPGDAGAVHSRRRLAQPRLRRVRRGRHRRRLDDAGIRLVDGLHLLHARAPAPRRVRRPAPAVGQRQGHRARAAAAVGRQTVAGHVGRARRCGRAAADCLSQHDREHDGGSGGAERHLRARRRHRATGSGRKASPRCRTRRSRPGSTRSTSWTKPST